MAVTNITITQDNTIGSCTLLSVHNPLVFLIDVEYTSTPPEVLHVDIQNANSEVLATFNCIPYDDPDANTRTFAFIASEILKAYMYDTDDFESAAGTLEHVPGATRVFTLWFYIGAIADSIWINAAHASRQFGQSPAMEDIYWNDDETYYGGAGMPVYVYFYNWNEDNIITVDSETPYEYALLDYDDMPLTDADDLYLKSL